MEHAHGSVVGLGGQHAQRVPRVRIMVPPPPRKTSSMTSAQERRRRMSRALSRRLSGKTGSVEEGSALFAENGGASDDVLVEDLPMPDRRSISTTDVSLRSSAGDGEAAARLRERFGCE